MKQDRKFQGVWIPADLWLADGLSITEKCLLVEINSLDNDEERGCFASNEYLSKFLGLSAGRVANMISDLKKRSFIVQVYFDGRNRGLRLHENAMNLHENVKAAVTESLKLPSRKREHSNIVNSIEEKDIVVFDENDPAYLVTTVSIERPLEEVTPPAPPTPAAQIIDYLNAKTGRKYRAKTATTVKAINARLEDGYTVADFFAVIDNRVAAWLHNPDMAEYLRPETLFRPAHFESYLNAGINPAKANTNDALKDCNLPADIAPRYEAYFNHALQTYPALLESATKVFSHCDYLDYWNNTSTPGLPFSLTAADKRRVMLSVHEQLNANRFMREKYSSVFAAYLVAVKQSMKQEQIKL